jgi:hypothetical protein
VAPTKVRAAACAARIMLAKLSMNETNGWRGGGEGIDRGIKCSRNNTLRHHGLSLWETFDLLMMGFQKGIIKGFQKYNLEFKR